MEQIIEEYGGSIILILIGSAIVMGFHVLFQVM